MNKTDKNVCLNGACIIGGEERQERKLRSREISLEAIVIIEIRIIVAVTRAGGLMW